jgi:VWFA-related protein
VRSRRLVAFLAAPLLIGSAPAAQDDPSRIRVDVVLVQLNVAVTDSKGNYVRGLRPEDFVVVEDKIPEKIATFEEGIDGPRTLTAAPPAGAAAALGHPTAAAAPGEAEPAGERITLKPLPPSETNVFILFDTSNYMYRGFVFAQDAISDFIRSLEQVSKVALYSYSRNLSRVTALTTDRSQALRGVRNTVAGDDAALYNGLLMTVRDAAPLTGKKAIVVFSNGPDNASLVPPEDIAELAQSTGTIIYMVSTREAQAEPVSAAAFERISKATGGKAYFSKDWRDEKQAFASIRDDLGHLYTLSYYPQSNPNRGWRAISVRLEGKNLQKYKIRTRAGYRLLRQQPSSPMGLASSDAGPAQ